MLTRRIAASACALCLTVTVPAVATAKDVRFLPHVQHAVVVTGDTKDDLAGTVPAGSTGDTKTDLPGSAAPTPASHNTAVAPQATSQPTASTDDGTNGWRLAAIIEAGLFAAFAIGAAVFVANRQHRAPRMGV
jgi:hypothetical protein